MKIHIEPYGLRRYTSLALGSYAFNMRHVMRKDHPDLQHLTRMWRVRRLFDSPLYKACKRLAPKKPTKGRKIRRGFGIRTPGLLRWRRYGKVHSVRKIHAF